MKTYYCQRLFEDINFSVEKVYICSGMNISAGYKIPKSNANIKKYLKELLSWRKNIYRNALLGKVPQQCHNCVELKKENISVFKYLKNLIAEKYHIKRIIIKSFRQCEYACIYCIERKFTKGRKVVTSCKSSYYDFLPIIKELINNKMITNDTIIEFQGGSVSVLDEFEDILDEVVNFGVKELSYHLNGLKYIPKIAEYAKKIPTKISVSIDSGSKETYAKIKNSDTFDDVIGNIKKYAQAGIACTVKYIIVRNYNDNLDEIKKYCDLIKAMREETKCKNIYVMLELDFHDSLKEWFKVPVHYVEIFKYTQEFCIRNDIIFSCHKFIQNMLESKIKELYNFY